MALQKEITLASGHTCSYWRITQITSDFATGSGTVTLSGYLDAEARAAGKPPLSDARFWLAGFKGHGGTAEAYEWVKEQPSTKPGYMIEEEVDVPAADPAPLGATGAVNAVLTTRKQTIQRWVPEEKGPPMFADAVSV